MAALRAGRTRRRCRKRGLARRPTKSPLGGDAVHFTRPFVEGVIARMTNDEHKAQLAFTAARAEQEKTVQAQPDYGPAWCVLGCNRCRSGAEGGRLARRAARGRAASRGKGLNQWSPHDRIFGDDCCVGR